MPGWLKITESVLDASRPGLPVVDRARCLAARHPATACDACVAACPRGAIRGESRPRIDPDRCDECGICAAACPTGAVARGPDLRAERGWLDRIGPGDIAAVRCDRAGGASPSGVVRTVSCAAAVRPSDLVVAAVRGAGAIHLHTGDCATCPRGAAAPRIRWIAATARAAMLALGRPGVEVDVVATGAAGTRQDHAPEPVSRRDFFRLAQGRARRAAVDLARDTETARARLARSGPVPGWRTRLSGALETEAASGRACDAPLPAGLGIGVVDVGSGCDGCGLCVLACPHGALAMAPDRPHAAVAACTACGLCAEMCPVGALHVRPPTLALFGRIGPTGAGSWIPEGDGALPERSTGQSEGPDGTLLTPARLGSRGRSADAAMRQAALRSLTAPGRARR